MKATRLVLGLIGIPLAAIMFYTGIMKVFQVSVINGFSAADLSAAANYGFFIAPVFLIGAIVMAACSRKGIIGGCITCTLLFLICGLLGMKGLPSGNFSMFWLVIVSIYLLLSALGIVLNATLRL